MKKEPSPGKSKKSSRLSQYAKLMRGVRSQQPKVSSEEAYAQARRVLTAAGRINVKTFHEPEENLLISNARGGDVLRTAGGLSHLFQAS